MWNYSIFFKSISIVFCTGVLQYLFFFVSLCIDWEILIYIDKILLGIVFKWSVFYLINFGIVEFIVYYYISFLLLSKSSCVRIVIVFSFSVILILKFQTKTLSSCIMFRNYNFEVSIKNTIVFEKCIVLFFKTNDYTIRVIILYLLKKIKKIRTREVENGNIKCQIFLSCQCF